MDLLSQDEINSELSELSNGWITDDYRNIQKSFEFNDFKEALYFTNLVGDYAEEIPHHPEITLSYGCVKIIISTHDLGGISELDFELAKRIDRLKMDKESKKIFENLEILKNGNDYERRKAAGKLGNIGDIRSVTSLIKSLNDKDPFVRRVSASSLGKIGSEKAVYPLAVKLSHDEDGLSYAARDALINIGHPSVNELISRIKNKDVITRRRAVKALGEIGDTESIPHLSSALNDDDDGVRWRAAKYISINWDNNAVVTLKKLEKKDTSKKVREEAAETLKKISVDVKNLIPIFERGIKAIDEGISEKTRKKDIKHFYILNKHFLSLHTPNPYINRIYLYKGNTKIEGVKPMKNPKWGVITFQNNNELKIALEAAKESYLRIKDLLEE